MIELGSLSSERIIDMDELDKLREECEQLARDKEALVQEGAKLQQLLMSHDVVEVGSLTKREYIATHIMCANIRCGMMEAFLLGTTLEQTDRLLSALRHG